MYMYVYNSITRSGDIFQCAARRADRVEQQGNIMGAAHHPASSHGGHAATAAQQGPSASIMLPKHLRVCVCV